MYNKYGNVQRYGMICTLYLPQEVWIRKLGEYQAIQANPKTQQWRSTHRSPLIRYDDLEILETYNSEIRGFFNYYKLAINVSKSIGKFKHYMEYSMYKTFANKYKSSVPKILRKYQINGHFGVKYQTKKENKVRFFFNQPLRREKDLLTKGNPQVDFEPNTLSIRDTRTSLMDRLLAEKCEWCGKENVPLEMHHVKN